MRYAVYDEETLELVTVIKLQPKWAKRLLEWGSLAVPIVRPMQVIEDSSPPPHLDPISVMVRASRFANAVGRESFFLWVSDPENALLMKSEMLPGQREHLEDAFNRGIREAFTALSGLR